MEFIRKTKKFLRLMLKRASHYPEEVQIEITNVCNLGCHMCPRKALKVPIKHISLEVYNNILSKLINPHIITLTGWGEPLCHPQFLALIERANQLFPSAQVKFTTNGLLLNPEKVEKLLKYNTFQINISIDQLEEEEDSAFHSMSAELKNNIRFLLEYRAHRKRPYVRFQTIMQKDGWKVLKGIITYAAEVGVDGINLVRLDTRWSELERPTWDEERKIIKQARHLCRRKGLRFECANNQSLARKIASRFDSYCLLLDNFVYITVEGNVVPCCNLPNYQFGNLMEQSLKDIWHNHNFRQLRKKGQVKECMSCDALKYHYSPLQALKKKQDIVLQHRLT